MPECPSSFSALGEILSPTCNNHAQHLRRTKQQRSLLSSRRNVSCDNVAKLYMASEPQLYLRHRTTSATDLANASSTATSCSRANSHGTNAQHESSQMGKLAGALRLRLSRRATQNGVAAKAASILPAHAEKQGTRISPPKIKYTLQVPSTAPVVSQFTELEPVPSGATIAHTLSDTDETAHLAPPESAIRPRKRSLSVGGENACRDFFARQIEQYGLQSLLGSPVGVCYFLASTVLGYCPETLLFYLEAEHFRSSSFPSDCTRKRYAKGLYKAFISKSAPLEININYNMRQNIAGILRSDEPVSSMLFQETQDYVYSMLEQDLVQFRQRSLYSRMLAELSGSVSNSPQRKDEYLQRVRAVACLFNALSKSYGLHSLPASKAALVESEAPTFTKFADMDLASSVTKVALPAWICRIITRILDVRMPVSLDDACQMLRSADGTKTDSLLYECLTSKSSSVLSSGGLLTSVSKTSPYLPAHGHNRGISTSSLASSTKTHYSTTSGPDINTPEYSQSPISLNLRPAENSDRAFKKKSLQLLRLRFQNDASAATTQCTDTTDSHKYKSVLSSTRPKWAPRWGARRRKN